jgi:hypothetical protein
MTMTIGTMMTMMMATMTTMAITMTMTTMAITMRCSWLAETLLKSHALANHHRYIVEEETN